MIGRYAKRRDANEPELVKLAERLQWWMRKLDEPADWLGGFRGKWFLIEIKNPEVEGQAQEFTPKQREFHAEAFRRGLPVLIWRREADVLADSSALRAA